jgi:ATP-dependent DNA ligase
MLTLRRAVHGSFGWNGFRRWPRPLAGAEWQQTSLPNASRRPLRRPRRCSLARPAGLDNDDAGAAPQSPFTRLPVGNEWIYEVKLDGYRALAIKEGSRVQLRSRTNNDLTRTYSGVATAVSRLDVESAVLDGEIVAVGPDGRPSFSGAAASRRVPRSHDRVLRLRTLTSERSGFDQ